MIHKTVRNQHDYCAWELFGSFLLVPPEA